MKLSVIVPTLDGSVPAGLLEIFKSESSAVLENGVEVELIVVKGVSPISAARNEGLRRATGDYIAWVDSDDEISPDYFEVIISALRLPSSTSTPTFDYSLPSLLTFNIRQEWHDGSSRPTCVLDGRHCGQLWSKVFRRSLFDGLSFEGAVHEDYRIQCQMPRNVTRTHIDKVLYVYKRRASGLSQHHDAKAVISALWGLIKICNSWEMAKGIWERIWDFAKTPLRRLLRR